MEWTGAFLARAGRGVCDGLPAAGRVKYDLVRRGRLDDLLELLDGAPRARRRLGPYYGEYPGGATARLGRRDRELALTAHLDGMRFEHGRLRLTGHAYVNALGAASPDVQQLQIAAVRRGSRRALRMRLAPARLATMPVRRHDLEPRLQWSGFRASIAPEALLVEGEWRLFAYVRHGGLRRRRAVFTLDDPALARTIDIPVSHTSLVQATVSTDGRVA